MLDGSVAKPNPANGLRAEAAGDGAIEMARCSGVPIVPYATLPARYWRFRSWDAFRLPKPFSRIDVHYGAPITVPPDATFEDFPRYQQQITAALHEIEREHGREMTRPARAPASR